MIKHFRIDLGNMEVYDSGDERIVVLSENEKTIASSGRNLLSTVYELPNNLIRSNPTNEELAEKHCPCKESFKEETKKIISHYREGFVLGRNSFGEDAVHLTFAQLENLINKSREVINEYDGEYKYSNDELMDMVINPKFDPIEINVEFDEKTNKYNWETLNPIYEI